MKISVIIPVYNCALYLRECLDSVISQELPEGITLEVIIIDDGSEDESGVICDIYSHKYSNCVVKHQTNQGVSMARNNAIDLCTGDFVTFLDGDDILDKSAIKVLVENNFEAYDETFFGMYRFTSIKKSTVIPSNVSNNETKEEILRKIVQRKALLCVCGGIYRRSLFEDNHIRFQQGIRMGEDWQVSFRLFVNSSNYHSIPDGLYGYRTNEASATQRRTYDVLPDALIALNDIIDYAKEKNIVVFQEDIVKARSDLRRKMMKEALYSHLFDETDAALKKYGDQSLWKDIKYAETPKHILSFLIYRVVDDIRSFVSM